MSICLCDISALEAIRSSGKLVGELMDHPRASSLDGCRAPNAAELDDLLVGLGVRTRPVHVLTPWGTSTLARPGVRRHRRDAPLPRASLVRVKNDLFISSPELVVAQLAARRDYGIVDLALVATELCGTYLLDSNKDSWEGFSNIDRAVCSRSRITSMIDASASMRGAPKLRRALTSILDGLYSPMESVLALLLCLPRSLGGIGLSGLALNYRVAVAGSEYFIDLAIPKLKVGLEYNGLQYHAIEQSARDDRRQNDLIGVGWTIINVWIDDLKNPILFSRLLDSLFRAMDRRSRPGDDFLKRQVELRKKLVPGCRD